MDNKQLIFDFFDFSDSFFTEEYFISSQENQDATKYLTKFFSQKEFSSNSISSILLFGEKKSGKTHILNIFATKYQATFLTKHDLENCNLANIFSKNNFYIIENLEECNEEILLRAFNLAFEASSFLLLSASNISNFSIKDFQSRVKNILKVDIKSPSLDFAKSIISSILSRKQLKLNSDVLKFVCDHISYSYSSISNAVKIIEYYCNENQKKFTLNQAQKIKYLLKNC